MSDTLDRPKATVSVLSPPGTLTTRCRDRLKGVDEQLVLVVELARRTADFLVIEGVRTLARQKTLLAAGKSKTLKSKHLHGHAVDLVPLVHGQVTWNIRDYGVMAAAMKDAARKLSVGLVWGGDWARFVDGPHFELAEAPKPAAKPALKPAARK